MQRITSRQNAVVKQYRDAARGAVPDTILIDGVRLVGEALSAGVRLRHVMVAADAVGRPDLDAALHLVDPRVVPVATASSAVMNAVSPVQSSSTVVALAVRPSPTLPAVGPQSLAVVVCDMQNPGNVGAIVRVSEAAGASAVVVAGQSADPFGWKALRGSMGSAFRMPLGQAADVHAAVDLVAGAGMQVTAMVPRDGMSLFDADLTGPTALLVGGEGLGLPGDVIQRADQRVSIPMQAPVESLNAAVAAALLLYEARRQRAGAPQVANDFAVSRRASR